MKLLPFLGSTGATQSLCSGSGEWILPTRTPGVECSEHKVFHQCLYLYPSVSLQPGLAYIPIGLEVGSPTIDFSLLRFMPATKKGIRLLAEGNEP
jgi:hypothetical protein